MWKTHLCKLALEREGPCGVLSRGSLPHGLPLRQQLVGLLQLPLQLLHGVPGCARALLGELLIKLLYLHA